MGGSLVGILRPGHPCRGGCPAWPLSCPACRSTSSEASPDCSGRPPTAWEQGSGLCLGCPGASRAGGWGSLAVWLPVAAKQMSPTQLAAGGESRLLTPPWGLGDARASPCWASPWIVTAWWLAALRAGSRESGRREQERWEPASWSSHPRGGVWSPLSRSWLGLAHTEREGTAQGVNTQWRGH